MKNWRSCGQACKQRSTPCDHDQDRAQPPRPHNRDPVEMKPRFVELAHTGKATPTVSGEDARRLERIMAENETKRVCRADYERAKQAAASIVFEA